MSARYDKAQWPPLNGPFATRLVRLLPPAHGSPDDKIVCEIESVNLLTRPRFEALSYVWGESAFDSRVSIRGTGEISASNNLVSALSFLRPAKGSRLLWIDQLCINQANAQERAQQVSLMGQIYGQAYQVIVWLGMGSPAENNKAVCDLIQTLANLSELSARQLWKSSLDARKDLAGLNQDKHSCDKLSYTADLFIGKHFVWDRLINFLQNEWFYRTWTYQEVVLAKKCEVIWAKTSMPWETLGAACETLVKTSLRYLLDNTHRSVLQLESRRRMLKDANNTSTLLTFVASVRDRQAIDPRDKVFALVGLVQSLKFFPFNIDYTKPFENVYIELVEHSIKSHQNLDVLAYIQEQDQKDIPSWCPDWRERSHTSWRLGTRDYFGKTPFQATRATVAECTIHHVLKPQLYSRGMHVATITRLLDLDGGIYAVGPRRHRRGGWNREIWNRMYKRIIEGVHISSEVATTRGASDRYLDDLFEHSTAEGNVVQFALCRTLAADSLPLSGRNTTAGVYSITQVTFPEYISWRISRTGADAPSEVFQEYEDWVARCLLGRNVAVVEDVLGQQRLALVPKHAGPDDQIVLLLGGTTPFVVREYRALSYPVYEMIGESYVDGMMDGEWMDIAKAKDMSWKQFRLR